MINGRFTQDVSGLIHETVIFVSFNLASNVGAFVAFLLAGKMLIFAGIPMILGNVLGNHVGSRLAVIRGEVVIRTVLTGAVSLLLITLTLRFVV